MNSFFLACDAPRPWGLYFQGSASPQMEALVGLHDNIMFYLVIILFGVAWIVISIIRNYVHNKSPISNKYFNYGTLIELIWTITPALILILIAFPSFKLLYLMDEVTDPSLTVFVEGHQWYWSYQYPDFLSDDDEELEFDSYLVPESDLGDGLIEADTKIEVFLGLLLLGIWLAMIQFSLSDQLRAKHIHKEEFDGVANIDLRAVRVNRQHFGYLDWNTSVNGNAFIYDLLN